MARSKQVTRYVIMAAMLVAGLSLIGLMASSFGVGTDTIVDELLAICILLAVLMGAAFITAVGLRALQDRRERREERSEDGGEDED